MERILAILGGLLIIGVLLAAASRKAEAFDQSTAAMKIQDLQILIETRNESFDYDSRNAQQVSLRRLSRYSDRVREYFSSEKPVVAYLYPAIKNAGCTALRTMNLKPLAVQSGSVSDDIRSVIVAGVKRTFVSGARRTVTFKADGWVTQDGVSRLPTGTPGTEFSMCLQFADEIPVYSKNTPLTIGFSRSGPVFYGRTINAYIREI